MVNFFINSKVYNILKKYKNKMVQCIIFVIEEPSKRFFLNYAFISDFLFQNTL